MNCPCDSCARHKSCAFNFGFSECEEYLDWLNTPMSEEEKAGEREPYINDEWGRHIMRRFERVE